MEHSEANPLPSGNASERSDPEEGHGCTTSTIVEDLDLPTSMSSLLQRAYNPSAASPRTETSMPRLPTFVPAFTPAKMQLELSSPTPRHSQHRQTPLSVDQGASSVLDFSGVSGDKDPHTHITVNSFQHQEDQLLPIISSRPSPFHPLHAYTSQALVRGSICPNQLPRGSILTAIPPEEDIVPSSSPLPSSSPPRIFSSSPSKSDCDHEAHDLYLHHSPTSSPAKPELLLSFPCANHQLVSSAPGFAASLEYGGEDTRDLTALRSSCKQNSPPRFKGSTALDNQTQISTSHELLDHSSSPPMDVPYASSLVKPVSTDQASGEQSGAPPSTIEPSSPLPHEITPGLSKYHDIQMEDETGTEVNTILEAEDVHSDLIDIESTLGEVVRRDPIDSSGSRSCEVHQILHHAAAQSGTEAPPSTSEFTTSAEVDRAFAARKRSATPPSGTLDEPKPASKRQRVGTVPPNPKRISPSSQRVQTKKLSAPFRSPFRGDSSAPASQMLPSPSKANVVSTQSPRESLASTSSSQLSTPRKSYLTSTAASKDFTPRAAAQFKSPFKATSSNSGAAPTVHPATRLTPAIQALEAQAQLLRRAVKIREAEVSGKSAPLDTLAKKWKYAGQEVAREVWVLVKDNAQIYVQQHSGSGYKSGWGWEDKGDTAGSTPGEYSDGGNEEYEEEQEKKEDNIGTMLRQLRIDPITLGWDEVSEDFMD